MIDPNNYWDSRIYEKNSKININNIENTIDELKFNTSKIMVCGRGSNTHPDFKPRFSTPTTNIDSDLYVIIDHDPNYVNYITRKGSYALSLIVDPLVPKKINSLNGIVYWFSPEFLDYEIPKLMCGKFPRGNSGLTAVELASFFQAKYILLSGIKLTEKYDQFLESKDLIFNKIKNNGTKIFSLDGIIAEKLSYDLWCEL